jgi:hypothetical protein
LILVTMTANPPNKLTVIRLRGGKLVADNRSFITAATGS